MIQVLIVEDDPMVAEVNKKYLTAIPGFSCAGIVSNVTEAWTFIEQNPIDLVLLDVFMPGKSGLDLLREIRKEGKGIDVIVITAANDIENVKKALRLGAVDYLIKPFEFRRLESALTIYQKEYEAMNKREQLSQEELDNLLIYQKNKEPISFNLPKGLTKETLHLVVNNILKMNSKGFSAEQLANEVGISRVSVRKYLKFLTEIELVAIEVSYGTIGRPVTTYRLIEVNMERLERYIKVPE
ncbi:response regulator [Fictibacillus gelatini]|uniref:response regulator n=1 Tax=Fictibacillus gelatini TaxID=225985 RepID=UPI000478B566|nr:response regulator [Fictibacillus gelatini]